MTLSLALGWWFLRSKLVFFFFFVGMIPFLLVFSTLLLAACCRCKNPEAASLLVGAPGEGTPFFTRLVLVRFMNPFPRV